MVYDGTLWRPRSMNVLVTSAARKVLLIEGFQAALAGTGSVVAAEITPISPAAYLADVAVRVPPSDAPNYIDRMREICREFHIELVVPTRDAELPVWAANRSFFSEDGVRVHVSSPSAIETCQDKLLFHRFCVDHGHPVPVLVTEPTQADLPLFQRPRWSSGGVGAGRIDSLSQLVNQSSERVLNSFVTDDEFTIDVFIGQQGSNHSAVPRRRVQTVAGESVVGYTVTDHELVSASLVLCLDLGIEGHATVQAFRSERGIRFIEVNPRFGGASALSFAAGADSARWLVQEVRGEPLDPVPGPYRSDLVMLRHSRDIYLDAADLKASMT